jgi:hypothetical protein
MKAGKILLAAAFALTLAASANAGIHVWWQETGVTTAPGQTLQLECAIGTRCEWNLTMMIATDAGDGVLGWSEDLLVAPELFGIVSVKDNALPGDSPWSTLYSAGQANYGYYPGGYHILMGAYGQLAGFVPGPLNRPLLYITLSVNPMPGPASYYIDITSEGGGYLWSTTAEYGDFFGAQDPIQVASYGAYRTNAAISIHAIPEPSTVAFLGLGALALIRRRR